MVGQSLDVARCQYPLDGYDGGSAGFFVDDAENLVHRVALGFGLGPSGQFFRHGIEPRHTARDIGRHHGVADRAERHGEIFLARAQGLLGLLAQAKTVADGPGGENEDCQRKDRANRDGRVQAGDAGPFLLLADIQQALLFLVHLGDDVADGLHRSLAFAGRDQAGRPLDSVPSPGFNDLSAEVHFFQG